MSGNDKIEIEKWEVVCEAPLTHRLGVPNGWLYKVNANMAFVPFAHDTEYHLEQLAEAVEALKDLFEEATYTFSEGIRVIRIANIEG